MPTISEMFKPYLMDLFAEEAVFADDGQSKLRVSQELSPPVNGRRYAQSVVLDFEGKVLEEYSLALAAANVPRQDRIGDRIEQIVVSRLADYDPQGPDHEAFRILIDDRALDL